MATQSKTNEQSVQTLEGLSDIRRFFRRNETPIYFISATNFNLLGADEWVHHFKFINYIDCFDGQHPNLFVPPEIAHEDFESIEDINWYEGADLGIVVTRGRLMTDEFELNERAHAWIEGIKSHFQAAAPDAAAVAHLAPGALKAHPAPGSFKLL